MSTAAPGAARRWAVPGASCGAGSGGMPPRPGHTPHRVFHLMRADLTAAMLSMWDRVLHPAEACVRLRSPELGAQRTPRHAGFVPAARELEENSDEGKQHDHQG